MKFHEKAMGVCYLDNPLSSGVFTDEDAELLNVFMNQAAIAVENASLYQNLEAKVEERTRELDESLRIQFSINQDLKQTTEELENEKEKIQEINEELKNEKDTLRKRNEIMENDLEMARKIQMQFIPEKSIAPYIAFQYKPMEKVGGDFFDFITFKNNNWIGIFISDVSGHGVPAAFITSMIKSTLLQMAQYVSSPASILESLNNAMANQTGGNFITAFYGIYKPETREFIYSNAGHNAPYIIHDNNFQLLDIKSIAVPLAVMDNKDLKKLDKRFINETIILEKGCKLILYTDGLTEAVNINEKSSLPESEILDFESKMLMDSMSALKELPAEDFIRELYNILVAFRGCDDFEDDVCMICVDVE